MLYFDQTPADFAPRFEVVSCLVECKNKILLLKRLFDKPEGGTWSMPAGKVDDDISIVHAVRRELREETGISPTHDPEFVLRCGVRFADGYDFVFHKYRLTFDVRPNIVINYGEHSEYCWTTPQQALRFNLIQDEGDVLRRIYRLR
jgi:8-oxo-dGTP pyrophosphatase MutT (NUDIX family)